MKFSKEYLEKLKPEYSAEGFIQINTVPGMHMEQHIHNLIRRRDATWQAIVDHLIMTIEEQTEGTIDDKCR